jgi:hypothetical protein
MIKLDCHVHSKYSSDAITEPKTLVKIAKKKGLSIVITDHNNGLAWKELLIHARKHGVWVIKGEEIKTFENNKMIGELIGIFMQEPVKPKNYLEVIDELKTQGALISVPHPFDCFRNNFKKLEECIKKIDLIEGFNARCFLNSFNVKAKEFSKKNFKPMIAGSDAHMPWELGKAFTLINVEPWDEESLRKKLFKGKTIIKGKRSSLLVHFFTQLAKMNLIKSK